MRVIVFDLDDTLYDEITYVKSGFQSVANYLEETYDLDKTMIFGWMWDRLKTHGRGQVFDDLLKVHGLYSKKLAKKCLAVYRLHRPEIELDHEANLCLKNLDNYPLYIVTDGNKLVQHNKLVALGLYDRMKFCFVSHRYGVKHAKPSPYCFLKIAECEKVSPEQVVYIGDNPNKDFVGIKNLGFRTIRIMKGNHKNVEKSPEYEADYRISNLNEIDDLFLDKIFSHERD